MKTYYNMILALVLLLSFIPITEAVTFCDGNELKENVTVNDEVITIGNDICNFNCSDWTWSTFGNPGCEESDFTFAILIMIIFLILILLIRVANK